MSIRRQSCEACFKGKRKCDLQYPACQRCSRNKRTCHYLYPPHELESNASSSDSPPTSVVSSTTGTLSIDDASANWSWSDSTPIHEQQSTERNMDLAISLDPILMIDEMLDYGVPCIFGQLGELQPVHVKEQSWMWIASRLKSYPETFTRHMGTDFINKHLSPPRPLRKAFGICASTLHINDSNKSFVLQNVDDEMCDLLNSTFGSSLAENLSKFQSMVLYQIIRIFFGNVRHRQLAEGQATMLQGYGLQLLEQLDAHLLEAQPSWENWIFAESARRTVLTLIFVHSTYWIFKYGDCLNCSVMASLLVAPDSASWESREAYALQSKQDQPIKYLDYVRSWYAFPSRHLGSFQKMLLIKHEGIERIEALAPPTAV